MKRKILTYVVLYYIVILSLLLLYSLLPGLNLEEEKSIIADENATVDAFNPNSNYGGSHELKVGYLVTPGLGGSQVGEVNNWTSFIKFDLSEAPPHFHKAELRLDYIHVEATTLLEIYETNNNWSEYSIVWDNAPSYGALVAFSYITENIIHSIDVLDALEEETVNWSICITSEDTNWITIASRQCYSEYIPPEIIVYYYETSNLPIMIAFIVVIVLTIAIFGGMFYNNYRKKRK